MQLRWASGRRKRRRIPQDTRIWGTAPRAAADASRGAAVPWCSAGANFAQRARHELRTTLRRRWRTDRSGVSEELCVSSLCRSSELRRTAASARHMLLHVPPRYAADEQEWQEMAQEHLFARAEQSICSAPHAGVSQVPRNLFYMSDYFSLVVSRVCRRPTLASAPVVRPHRTTLASCPRADPAHCFALSGVSAVATAAWQRISAACAAVHIRAWRAAASSEGQQIVVGARPNRCSLPPPAALSLRSP